MNTFEDWTEFLYENLLQKINNKFNVENEYSFILNICSNKNFDLIFFKKHPELRIDYQLLSYNPNITLDYIVENKYCFWNDVVLNKTLGRNIKNYILYDNYYNELHRFYKLDILYEIYETWDNLLYIEKHFNHKIRYELLSMNKNISWDIIINNINEDWNFEYLVIYNKNITVEIVLNNKKYFNNNCVKLLTKNKYIKWSEIVKYDNYIEWNYTDLSLNINITIDIVLNNINKKWCFNRLSSNPNITIDIILQHKNFKWSMYWYSFNPNIRLNDIDKMIITNDTLDINLIIKNLCLNNYDIDRIEYVKNDIQQTDILNINNFELILN